MEKEKIEIDELVEAVRQIAYGVHVYLANGYLEKVYENCLRHRLEKAGYQVEAQKNLKVHDEDGYLIGDYFADLVVNGCLLIELKAVKALAGEHYAQTLNYLKITGYQRALLVNFGSYRFETRTVVPNFSPSAPLHGLQMAAEEVGRAEVERLRKGPFPSAPLHGLQMATEEVGRAEVERLRKDPSPSAPLHGLQMATEDVGRAEVKKWRKEIFPSPPLHG